MSDTASSRLRRSLPCLHLRVASIRRLTIEDVEILPDRAAISSLGALRGAGEICLAPGTLRWSNVKLRPTGWEGLYYRGRRGIRAGLQRRPTAGLQVHREFQGAPCFQFLETISKIRSALSRHSRCACLRRITRTVEPISGQHSASYSALFCDPQNGQLITSVAPLMQALICASTEAMRGSIGSFMQSTPLRRSRAPAPTAKTPYRSGNRFSCF